MEMFYVAMKLMNGNDLTSFVINDLIKETPFWPLCSTFLLIIEFVDRLLSFTNRRLSTVGKTNSKSDRICIV